MSPPRLRCVPRISSARAEGFVTVKGPAGWRIWAKRDGASVGSVQGGLDPGRGLSPRLRLSPGRVEQDDAHDVTRRRPSSPSSMMMMPSAVALATRRPGAVARHGRPAAWPAERRSRARAARGWLGPKPLLPVAPQVAAEPGGHDREGRFCPPASVRIPGRASSRKAVSLASASRAG